MEDILLMPRQVIQDAENGSQYRVLWISQDHSLAYWICLSSSKNTPVSFDYHETESRLSEGLYILAPDPFTPLISKVPTEAQANHRDKAWKLIKDAVTAEPDIYAKGPRAEILKKIEEQTGIHRTNLYEYLGKYWKGGMIPNALLPSYENCGKATPLGNPSAGRRGRKKVPGAEGKILTVQDVQNFEAALKEHYYSSSKLSLEKTYQEMQKAYYAVRDENGNFISLMSPDEIPSRAQFLYWHRKNKDVLCENKSRDGSRNYDLKYRSSIEKTETFLSGPCAAAQIDATVADIFLVRQDDRNAIVGRPTMYFLMDCFSRMVMGMHITLDPPSWTSAARCILNSLENKVDYCARYGITIAEEEWTCRHSPSMIIADRGEMESRTADELVKGLGISIENMPPYRGDLKGIIEQHFHLIDVQISDIPGKMGKDYGERCTEDYRLNATLDIREFTQIIIRYVLLYNNYHYMESHVRSSDMRQLGVLPVPRDLWSYGMRYRNGAQKIVDVAKYRYVLLPKSVASITDNGIQFKGLFYGCEQGFREKWFDSARALGRTNVSVAYDPEDAAHIYLVPDAGQEPVECFLLDGNKMTEPLTVAEVEQINKREHEQRERYRHTEDTESARTEEMVEKIIEGAADKHTATQKSNAQRIKEIAENRKAEAELSRSASGKAQKEEGSAAPPEKAADFQDPIQQILDEALDDALGGDER